MTTKTNPSTADTATLLTGRLEFGDRGIASVPLDGELALTSPGGRPWQSRLSTNALETAEQLWTHRLSDDEATAITRVVLDVDLAFLGLEASWGTARFSPITSGAAIEFEADVRPTSPRSDHAQLRAAVRVELVNGAPEFAEVTLTDTSQVHVEHRQDVELPPSSMPGIDALAATALQALDHALSTRALPARTHWTLSYTEAPAWDHTTGTCGELEIWTIVPRPDAPGTDRPIA